MELPDSTPSEVQTDPAPTPSPSVPEEAAGSPAEVGPDIAHAPPLAGLAAFSGLLAMFLVRVLIPLRDPESAPASWELIRRIGTFFVNLSALSAMAALIMGLSPWLRAGHMPLRRRLMIAAFSGMLLPVWIRAVFLSRDAMNGALASLGSATAYSLATMLVVTAIRGSGASLLQTVPATLVAVCNVCGLALLTLQSLALISPLNPVHQLGWLLGDIGEAAYLGVLLCALTLLPARPWGLRDHVALAIGAVLTVLSAIVFYAATRVLGRELAVSLYYAQHIAWFLDDAIWLYAIPLSIGFGAAVVGMLQRDAVRQQLGTAVLTWMAAGFTPRAPWRFTLLALAGCLIARAISARVAEAEAQTQSPSQAT